MSKVVIAPARRADAPELIQANLESRALHHPWAVPFTDMDGFDRWWGRLETDVGLVARDGTSGAVVGVITISQIVRGLFQSAYLGFYSRAGFVGRGLMTEAVRLATRHAFDDLGLHRLEANIQPDNLRSIALVRRLGFRKEGFSPRYLRIAGAWRDHERWALLADEPGQ
jgi:ribosomal-protein-alanine N-acetyltransferase